MQTDIVISPDAPAMLWALPGLIIDYDIDVGAPFIKVPHSLDRIEWTFDATDGDTEPCLVLHTVSVDRAKTFKSIPHLELYHYLLGDVRFIVPLSKAQAMLDALGLNTQVRLTRVPDDFVGNVRRPGVKPGEDGEVRKLPGRKPMLTPTDKEVEALLTLRRLGVAVTALARVLRMRKETLFAWFALQQERMSRG